MKDLMVRVVVMEYDAAASLISNEVFANRDDHC